jgi:hypothetical protein
MDDLLCPTLVQRERSVQGGRVVPMANGATLYVSNHNLQMLLFLTVLYGMMVWHLGKQTMTNGNLLFW